MRRKPLMSFWDAVLVDDSINCWEWTGALHSTGYGWLTLGGKQYKAHRLAWELTNGAIPDGDGYHGQCVLHKCDNRKCVNPAHLFLGTHQDNIKDMVSKGRASRRVGTSNPNYRHGGRCWPAL